MNKRKAILALLLLVPAPTIGALFGMVIFPKSVLGVALFGLSKVWLLALPVIWIRFITPTPVSLSRVKNGGIIAGILSGLALSCVIMATYLILGNSIIDRDFFVSKLTTIGLASLGTYVGAAAYWILVNSVLEEYVWRWFCLKQCEYLFRPRIAVILSALFFTLHHIVAMRVYFGAATVLICALGVFLGAIIWSAMYMRYRSIWPGYVSHAIVDLCVFAVAASMLFG